MHPKYHFALSLFLTSASTLLLALVVFLKAKKRKINYVYSFWGLCVGMWSLFFGLTVFIHSEKAAQFVCHFLHLWAIMIPGAYLHFVLLYIGKFEQKKKTVYFLYGLTSLTVLVSPSKIFLYPQFRIFLDYYLTSAGPLYPIHIATFLITIFYVYWQLILSIKVHEGEKRKQLLYFLWINLIGYTGGMMNYLMVYDIFIYPFYPFGNYTILLYMLVVAVLIMRFRFLDIDIILKKTLVFAGLLTFVFAVFSAATFLVQEVFAKYGAGRFWTYGISLSLIVLSFDSLRNWMLHMTDRYLFQKKYDYQKVLKDATRGMSKIESLHRLLGLVVHFVTMKMRVKNAAVMMRRRDQEFELGFQRGYKRNFLDYRLDDTNPLIHYLIHEKEAISVDMINDYLESDDKDSDEEERKRDYDFQAIKLSLQDLEACAAVPSFLGRELRSILVVGEKKSGHAFSHNDLNLLFTLAQESAIAIENAKLYDEAINKSSQLGKINEQLEYSRNLLMKALRETEIANKQLQDTQAQLIHEQKMATLGRLAASVGHEVNNPLTILSMNVSRAILKYRKNPDLKVGDILELFQKMEQNIGRIKAVVNTLTGLLKKSEKGKFEPLSLKLILEETLPLVQFQTYLDNLSGTEVDFVVPGNTPLIRGDLERLQEVFLNLFINAYHAMQGRRNRRIRVTAEVSSANPGRVAVNFTDNGCGMTEEVMKKIFNYGFTTKPPGRGSGMGLYMCKYIIELHGGEIRVNSKVGEGTTFTILLPAYEETSGEAGNLRIEARN